MGAQINGPRIVFFFHAKNIIGFDLQFLKLNCLIVIAGNKNVFLFLGKRFSDEISICLLQVPWSPPYKPMLLFICLMYEALLYPLVD